MFPRPQNLAGVQHGHSATVPACKQNCGPALLLGSCLHDSEKFAVECEMFSAPTDATLDGFLVEPFIDSRLLCFVEFHGISPFGELASSTIVTVPQPGQRSVATTEKPSFQAF